MVFRRFFAGILLGSFLGVLPISFVVHEKLLRTTPVAYAAHNTNIHTFNGGVMIAQQPLDDEDDYDGSGGSTGGATGGTSGGTTGGTTGGATGGGDPDQFMKKCHGQSVPVNTICLLEGIPGTNDYFISITPSMNQFSLSAAFVYLKGKGANGAFDWILRIGIGVCVLNGAIGGMKIVMSGLDGSGTEEGKSKLIWSIVGLVIFLLAGTILNYLNPQGFSI